MTRPVAIPDLAARVKDLAATLPEHAGGYERWPVSSLLGNAAIALDDARRFLLDGATEQAHLSLLSAALLALTVAARVQHDTVQP